MMMRYAIIVLIIFSGIIVANDAFSTLTTFQLDEKFNDKVDDTNVLVNLNKSSIMRCAAFCEDHPDCVAFFINTRTRTCQGQSAPSNANMTGLRSSPGSRYYRYNSTICTSATTISPSSAPKTPSPSAAPITASPSAVAITTSPSAAPMSPTTAPFSPTTTLSANIAAPFVCPQQGLGWSGGVLPDGKTYHYLVNNTVAVDLVIATYFCATHGGTLPKIYDVDKMNFYLNNIVTCPDLYGHGFWIDGSNVNAVDKTSPDAYKTSDGIVIPQVPDLWYVDRPNRPLNQNCIQSKPTFNYYLDDTYCDESNHAVLCEKNLG